MICSLSDTKRAAPVTTKCMCRNNLSDFFSVKTLLFKTVRLYAEYCPNTKTRGNIGLLDGLAISFRPRYMPKRSS